jgi:hypothetical protein
MQLEQRNSGSAVQVQVPFDPAAPSPVPEKSSVTGKAAHGEYGAEQHGYAADARVDVHHLALDSASERAGGSPSNMFKAGNGPGKLGHVSGGVGHRSVHGPSPANSSDEHAKDSVRERPAFPVGHATTNTVYRSTVNPKDPAPGAGAPYGYEAPARDSYFSEDAAKRAPAGSGRYPVDQLPQRPPSGGGGVPPPRKGRSTSSTGMPPMQLITYLAVVISVVLTANLAHRVGCMCCSAQCLPHHQQCSAVLCSTSMLCTGDGPCFNP